MGWTCPKCQSVYGPHVNECWRCNKPDQPTLNPGPWYIPYTVPAPPWPYYVWTSNLSVPPPSTST